jgi:hypothetical protein
MNTNDYGPNTSPNFADPKGVDHTAFRMYVGSLNIQEKVNYLQFLETNFRSSISNEYFSCFQEFDPVLLTVEPVELSTRILYVYSDINR